MVHEITDANFSAMLSAGTPFVVDCWAPWCGPCKMMHPVIDEIAAEYDGRITVGKLNVDENPEVCEQFGIMSIPTILLFKDGQLAGTQVGFTPKAKLVPVLDSLL